MKKSLCRGVVQYSKHSQKVASEYETVFWLEKSIANTNVNMFLCVLLFIAKKLKYIESKFLFL